MEESISLLRVRELGVQTVMARNERPTGHTRGLVNQQRTGTSSRRTLMLEGGTVHPLTFLECNIDNPNHKQLLDAEPCFDIVNND